MIAKEGEKGLDTFKLAGIINKNHLIGLGIPLMLKEFGPLPVRKIGEKLGNAEVTVGPKTLQKKLEALVEAGVLDVKEGIYDVTEDMDKILMSMVSQDKSSSN